MEVVLTRLRDFSCKAATFDDCKSAEMAVSREVPKDSCAAKESRRETCAPGEHSPIQLDIESALAWLRRELMEMRSQDQVLIRKLMDLHTGIQELKLECAEAEEEQEEEAELEGWDSGSEAGGSSVYSSSGEVGFTGSLLATSMPPPFLLYHSRSLPRQIFSRRSSVP
ncbi:hypothetical protein ANANG_G00180340 [Anguilla anguilla]|uniref:Uncharacterized protein n=1 Tax=Anguilla anguilla TaxID=7936 RepID=A0A9D3M6H7_ANGAN|nr:hypothetical protein ANANG_G00180340 [Anguilla anguilla]